MSTMMSTLGLDKLTGDEKSQLFRELQEELAPDAFGISPLNEAQKAELQRRLADIDENPKDWIPWDDVRAEVQKRYRP